MISFQEEGHSLPPLHQTPLWKCSLPKNSLIPGSSLYQHPGSPDRILPIAVWVLFWIKTELRVELRELRVGIGYADEYIAFMVNGAIPKKIELSAES